MEEQKNDPNDDYDKVRELKEKGLIIFGRDVSRIPCFRNSFLYGISGGIGSGLVYFMFTSRTNVACHFAVGSFMAITMSYWTQCRYKYSQTKFEMAQLQELMKQHTTYEGTETERHLDSKVKPEVVKV